VVRPVDLHSLTCLDARTHLFVQVRLRQSKRETRSWPKRHLFGRGRRNRVSSSFASPAEWGPPRLGAGWSISFSLRFWPADKDAPARRVFPGLATPSPAQSRNSGQASS